MDRDSIKRSFTLDGQDYHQAIEDALMTLQKLVDSVKQGFKIDRLQNAISSLKPFLENGTYTGGTGGIVRHRLLMALLTRYGIHGWIEDLDECLVHFNELDIAKIASENNDENIQVVQIKDAVQDIQESRNSLDTDILTTVINIVEEVIVPYTHCPSESTITIKKAELLVVYGNALVLRYINHRGIADLGQAAMKFQEAEKLCTDHVPLVYTCLTALAHIECLLSMECRELEARDRLRDYMARAANVDKEGSDSFDTGTKMLEGAVYEAELQAAITHLSASLHHRMAPHPRRSVSLHQLSRALLTRFRRVGDPQDLEEYILLHRETLDLRPTPHPNRHSSLNNLANALFTRFERKGLSQDLYESIEIHRESLGLRPVPHPGRASSLNNLGIGLFTRFKQKGTFEDLQECVLLHQEAVMLQPRSHPDRSSSLNNLAAALYTRFELKGAFEDLEESISFQREALDIRSTPHPDRSVSLNNLANALSIRFEQTGSSSDLEDAIELFREALKLRPPPHPGRSTLLINLGATLFTCFKQTGASRDLHEAITLQQEALDLHPNRPASLNNLSNAIFALFEQQGPVQNLEKCISLHREALNLLPVQHPDRFLSLNNLANILSARFEHAGTFEDLEQAISLYREAVNTQPMSNPSRSRSLDNLASALSDRFEQKGTLQDLEECIVLYREALSLQPAPHPNRPASLNNLARALIARYHERGNSRDLEDSIALSREALELQPASHPNRVRLMENLGLALSIRFRYEKSPQDLAECIKLYEKALSLRQQSHVDYPASLRNVALAFLYSFKNTSRSEDLEKCISLYKQALFVQPAPHHDRPKSLYNLAEALQHRFLQQHVEADIENALQCYEEAAKYKTGSLYVRFHASRKWAACAHAYSPGSALDAYHYTMGLLPELASLDLTLLQRQDVLEYSREVLRNAVKCAIDQKQYDMAVIFLATGRSTFWSQALQLHTPTNKLSATHPDLAEKLIRISRQLEHASHSSSDLIVDLPKKQFGAGKYTGLSTLADERHQTIEEIRKIPGFKGFLSPPSLLSLQSATSGGPVVWFNASDLGCDVLIMRQTGHLVHVPLLDVHLKELQKTKVLVEVLARARSEPIDTPQARESPRVSLGRDWVLESDESESQETFQSVLKYLWINIVKPVIEVLGIEKMVSEPSRIWWCPTGPFTSLPIHAAGIYGDNGEPIDCLFEYVVSSYCTSPQDLLHPPPVMNQGFKMTAVIEPEAPGAAFLPATHEELKKIKQHIPDSQYLITHVGSTNTPTQVDDLLSDIQKSSFAHFGCHGMQNPTNPLESCLLLSGGKLTMARIIKECKVREGALAYLSACQTAKGDEVRPDESLNLVATMMFAGFKSVVGTMWSILDEDAPIVADVFYSHLFRHGKEAPPDVRDAAYGLHLGTKLLREKGHPFCSWVPYVHYGI